LRSCTSSAFSSRIKTLRCRGRRDRIGFSLQPRHIVDPPVRVLEEDEDGRSVPLPPRRRQTSGGAASSTHNSSSSASGDEFGVVVVASTVRSTRTNCCAGHLSLELDVGAPSDSDESRRGKAVRGARVPTRGRVNRRRDPLARWGILDGEQKEKRREMKGQDVCICGQRNDAE
jgi:hypothetical protein